MEDYRAVLEYSPPREEGPAIESNDMPREWNEPVMPSVTIPEEFGGGSGEPQKEEGADRHRLIKKLLLMPVASAATVVTIVFSSYGYDPLGDDFLNHDAHYEHYDGHDDDGHDGNDRDQGHSGDSHSDRITHDESEYEDAYVNVYYVPTGETFVSGQMGRDGMREAQEWVESVGGDPDTMVFLHRDSVPDGYDVSDDAILIGDTDDFDNLYVAQGTVTKRYKNVAYYEAYAAGHGHGYDEHDPWDGQGYDEHDPWDGQGHDEPYEEPWEEGDGHEDGQEGYGQEIVIMEGYPICVHYGPTDELFYPTADGREGIEEAQAWLRSVGGDPYSLTFMNFKREESYQVEDGVLSRVYVLYALYEAE